MRGARQVGRLALLAMTLTLGLAGRAPAADQPDLSGIDEPTGDNPRCLRLSAIKRLEIIDDQTILFHMRGGEYWINKLPHRCPGLSRHRPIKYKTSLNRLCDLDMITVMNSFGSGLQPGATCGLGKFQLPGADVLEALQPGDGPLEEEDGDVDPETGDK